MNDEFKNDEPNTEEDVTTLQKAKGWLQENLRIIVSVLIVLLIASSIYSYSKRGEKTADVSNKKDGDIEKILSDLSSENKETTTDDTKDTNAENKKDSNTPEEKSVSDTAATTEKDATDEVKNTSDQKETATKTDEAQESVQTETSQETETSFVESASRGDGVTKLARKALAHYLEKNPDSSLTPEHKIYIEDYLRKNVNFHGRVFVGTSVEFSKSLIKDAIDASKKLNDKQLQNLHKYAVNVQF